MLNTLNLYTEYTKYTEYTESIHWIYTLNTLNTLNLYIEYTEYTEYTESIHWIHWIYILNTMNTLNLYTEFIHWMHWIYTLNLCNKYIKTATLQDIHTIAYCVYAVGNMKNTLDKISGNSIISLGLSSNQILILHCITMCLQDDVLLSTIASPSCTNRFCSKIYCSAC